MPNLILCGPPGIGKTTSILCLAHQLLGENYKNAVLELNASDDRGIDVVREKIKMFAKKKVTLPPGRHKVVILDEADNMTNAAQQALRRTMEIYSDTTRFALACNLSNKIIEPIQSRCAVLRYTRLEDEQMLKRLLEVAKAENVKYIDNGLDALLFTADGDMRQAINNLQSTSSGFGLVNEDNVFKVCDKPHPRIAQEIIHNCTKLSHDYSQKLLFELINEGYSSIDIVGTIFKVVKYNKNIDEKLQLLFIKEIGFTHMNVLNGHDSKLQLSALISRMCLRANELKKK
eukprot:TRINITY_DN7562_c0_g1_i1.p1 TRINITY_DN7562_c0_g1~~TRINITY_DN7562_c0_g1_i1.p1  ORF type:complete len:288 (-),score=81.68 TRINITY_DN7562_c0_g1_i1:122-985(-)